MTFATIEASADVNVTVTGASGTETGAEGTAMGNDPIVIDDGSDAAPTGRGIYDVLRGNWTV